MVSKSGFSGQKNKTQKERGGKVCERRQPGNKEPPPQQKTKKQKKNPKIIIIKKITVKEGATWQKYCTGVSSTPGGGVRGEKEDVMES